MKEKINTILITILAIIRTVLIFITTSASKNDMEADIIKIIASKKYGKVGNFTIWTMKDGVTVTVIEYSPKSLAGIAGEGKIMEENK